MVIFQYLYHLYFFRRTKTPFTSVLTLRDLVVASHPSCSSVDCSCARARALASTGPDPRHITALATSHWRLHTAISHRHCTCTLRQRVPHWGSMPSFSWSARTCARSSLSCAFLSWIILCSCWYCAVAWTLPVSSARASSSRRLRSACVSPLRFSAASSSARAAASSAASAPELLLCAAAARSDVSCAGPGQGGTKQVREQSRNREGWVS